MKHKMYCIFAKESIVKMNGNRGKLASMAGHAYLHSFWDAMHQDDPMEKSHKREQAIGYHNSERAYKITLVVDTVDQLVVLRDSYKNVCGVSLVTDAGFTVFDEPTTVCLGIGPISEDNIGDDLKTLKVLI